MVKVVLIGAGNLATQMGQTMVDNGLEVAMVYSRTHESAAALASLLKCDATTELHHIPLDADLYLFSVKDSVLPELLPQMPATTGVWAHTAGSISVDVFAPYANRYGVFYPLQTFSKERRVDFRSIPIYLEASAPEVEAWLGWVADMLTNSVRKADSDQRRKLHLAAVFACNFVNRCYGIAAELLEREGLAFDGLLPLIRETAAKVEMLSPGEAQTGPAVRYDQNVMNAHIAQLADPLLVEIYKIMSNSIYSSTFGKQF